MKEIKAYLYEGVVFINFETSKELTRMNGLEIRAMHTQLGGRSINRNLYFELEKIKHLFK